MKKCTLLFLLFAGGLLAGCKDEYRECHHTYPGVFTLGYDSTEADTILVLQYVKGSSFKKKITDSFFYYNIPVKYYASGVNDSFYFYPQSNWHDYQEDYELFDWRYTILADGSKTDVTDIVRTKRKTLVNHSDPCYSTITSMTINGKAIEGDPYNGFSDIIIRKP